MKFFIYSRKSVYTEKGDSVENQIEMCKKYISSKFSQAEQEIQVYEDEGFSAKNTDRPQFQKMLRDIRNQNPDFVICYRLDRISRNVGDFSALIEELNQRDISFVCIKEEFDTSKPMGKAMMYIASVFAQLERETIAERVRDNMLMLARTGRWLGGTTPMGYRSERAREMMIDGKLKTICKLKENTQEIQIADLIFEKYLELQSVFGVRKYLNEQGILSRSGGAFSLPGIKEILKNPVYCAADSAAFSYFKNRGADVCFELKDCSSRFGILSYNKRNYTKKHAPRQPVSHWIIAIGGHKGRISGEKWTAVQKLIEKSSIKTSHTSVLHNDYALVSGMIICKHCGGRMFAKKRSGGNSFDYICKEKQLNGASSCDGVNLNGPQTDAEIWKAVRPYLSQTAGACPWLQKVKRRLSGSASINPSLRINSEIKRLGGEMGQLLDVMSSGEMGPAAMGRIDSRINELEEAIAKLNERQAALENKREDETQTERLAEILSDTAREDFAWTFSEKRALVRALTEQIVWDGARLQVFLKGGDAGAPPKEV